MEQVEISFLSTGRIATCKPNPDYPNGCDIDVTDGKGGVWVEIPYPAPCCGTWIVGGGGLARVAVTAAGRPDDPRRVKIPYKEPGVDGRN